MSSPSDGKPVVLSSGLVTWVDESDYGTVSQYVWHETRGRDGKPYRSHNRYKRLRAPYHHFNGLTLVRLGLLELLRKFH